MSDWDSQGFFAQVRRKIPKMRPLNGLAIFFGICGGFGWLYNGFSSEIKPEVLWGLFVTLAVMSFWALLSHCISAQELKNEEIDNLREKLSKLQRSLGVNDSSVDDKKRREAG